MNTNNEGQNYNMNHNLNDNNSNQYNGMNNYNRHSNNTLNPNVIGNEGLSGLRVDHLNGTSNKSVTFKTEDLSIYQNQNNAGNRNIDNTPAWLKNKVVQLKN